MAYRLNFKFIISCRTHSRRRLVKAHVTLAYRLNFKVIIKCRTNACVAMDKWYGQMHESHGRVLALPSRRPVRPAADDLVYKFIYRWILQPRKKLHIKFNESLKLLNGSCNSLLIRKKWLKLQFPIKKYWLLKPTSD